MSLVEDEADVQVLQRENFDGSSATWLVVLTTAITTLPKILDGLVKVIEAVKIRTVRIGKIEIRNPTAPDIRALRKSLESHSGEDQ